MMDIEAKVKEILAEQLGVDEEEIKLDSHLVNDLGGDSLDLVELIMAFEEEYGVEISDDDADNIKTVGNVLSYIAQHTDKANS
jgi:acyl carrier protein